MLGLKPKRPIVVQPDPAVEAQLAETRAALAAQQARLEEERRQFQQAQQETLRQFADLAAAMANRPMATPQGLDVEPPKISSAGPSEDEENLDALRRGRRAFRIDLTGFFPGGTATGLNVPRG
jgi:hypothetical protein